MSLLLTHAGQATDGLLLPYFADGVVVGNFPSLTPPWDEISGITRSQKSANSAYSWVISDAGFNPVVMQAIRWSDAADGGIWTLTGAVGADVEDIGSATIGGQPFIYIADIGDNSAARTTVNIYRIKEPTITGSSGSLAAGTDYETIVCQYQSPPVGEGGTARRDAEAMFVDPADGTIYVLTKRTTQVQLFALDHVAFGGYVGTQLLSYVGDIFQIPSTQNPNSLGNGGRAVAADISPDGREIVVKNYQTIYHFPRAAGQSVFSALQNASPNVVKGYVGGKYPSSFPNSEPQGEGLCFGYDGVDLYTASEYSALFDSGLSNNYPLFKYRRLSKAYTEVSFQDGVAPTAGYTGTSDTYLDLAAPGTNHGSDATFICDWNATGTDERLGLLKFDLSAIPAGATIVGCDLALFISTEGSILQVHKMLEAWTESTTRTSLGHTPAFNDVQAASAYDVRFGDYTLLTTGAGGVDSIVLKMPVATVQAWVDGTLANNGWIFYQPSTLDGNGFQFRSKQAVTAADRPRLTVRYTQ